MTGQATPAPVASYPMNTIKQTVRQFIDEKIIAPFREDEVNTAIDQLVAEIMADLKKQSAMYTELCREFGLYKMDQINIVADLKAENKALREALLLCNSQQPSASVTPPS